MSDRAELFIAIPVFLTVCATIVTLVMVPFTRVEWSEQIVSGIVYNNENDTFPIGNTDFSVRASVDTYTDKKNTSSYCLPNGSPYIPLVKQAAADKNIRVVVTTKKAFVLVLNPFTCINNVTVERAK